METGKLLAHTVQEMNIKYVEYLNRSFTYDFKRNASIVCNV
jgi:hypothetical protein